MCEVASRFQRDPEDCAAFYYCFSVGQPLKQYPYHCPAALYFDEALQSCNYMAQVACDVKQAESRGVLALLRRLSARKFEQFKIIVG